MNSLEQEQIAAIAEVVIEKFNELQEEEQTKKIDRRLFNTKILLKHYRNFKARCEKLKEDNKLEVEEDPFIDIGGQYLSIESLTRSSARTLNLMRFIDKMIEFYKSDCERQGKGAIRKHETIMHYYIYDEKKTYADIAELFDVDERTVRRDLKEAVYALSVLIFGVDGLRIQL
ncbi:hypothetical protein [Lysinibacillus sphaericus]|uniref:Helix-turn-helix type 11 domain-containing protein n=1 Tax=Lysinibacillus sphaericus OT4b.31 TaxID=1285586 RepID=R7Z8B1_LYSSH|nr:hypothetical protein [Lysinibacillus sphaericus]EON70415.1 hypothetical protein H131_21927 [Lysinibacillus sphaericus OT4b.31]